MAVPSGDCDRVRQNLSSYGYQASRKREYLRYAAVHIYELAARSKHNGWVRSWNTRGLAVAIEAPTDHPPARQGC